MKMLSIIVSLLFSASLSANVVKLSIDDVTEKVSNENYLVLENAERVYQGKEKIKFSRSSLLPRLNIWNVLRIPMVLVDPLSIGDIVQDIAPFLVPANWFKVGQNKFLFQAQNEQYRAIWSNEVVTAKVLFYGALRNIEFSKMISDRSLLYKEIMEIARTRQIFNNDNVYAYNLIKNKYLSLTEDVRNLDNLIYSEKKDIQFMLGIASEDDIELTAITLPNMESVKPLEFSKIIFKAIEASPEVRQFEHMLNALSKVKGEILFNVLGSSTYSTGGVFENLPVQDGLGFGMGPSMRIAKSEGRILKLQLKSTVETIKKQVNVLVNEYNSLIENYSITKERYDLSSRNYEMLRNQILIGGRAEPLEIIEIVDNLFASQILLKSYKFRFVELVEKVKRITFSGDYSNGPSPFTDLIKE